MLAHKCEAQLQCKYPSDSAAKDCVGKRYGSADVIEALTNMEV